MILFCLQLTSHFAIIWFFLFLRKRVSTYKSVPSSRMLRASRTTTPRRPSRVAAATASSRLASRRLPNAPSARRRVTWATDTHAFPPNHGPIVTVSQEVLDGFLSSYDENLHGLASCVERMCHGFSTLGVSLESLGVAKVDVANRSRRDYVSEYHFFSWTNCLY